MSVLFDNTNIVSRNFITSLSEKLKFSCALRPVGVRFGAGQLSEHFRHRWVDRPDESGING